MKGNPPKFKSLNSGFDGIQTNHCFWSYHPTKGYRRVSNQRIQYTGESKSVSAMNWFKKIFSFRKKS